MLCDYQVAASEQLSSLLQHCACVVISGPTGFGKQTIAQATAESLGLSFHTVAVDAPARSVCRVLLGHEDLASPRVDDLGILAQEDACVLLSGLEHADIEILPTLREVMRQTAARGLREQPHAPVLLASINCDVADPVVSATDQLTRMVPTVSLPQTLRAIDLLQVVMSIVSSVGSATTLEESDLLSVALPFGGLASLRKWVMAALHQSDSLDLPALVDAITADMAPFVEQIRYRGRRISHSEYIEWVSQLDPAVRAIMDGLIRKMVERKYVMREADFHSTVDDLVVRSGIPRGSRVALAEWQPFGKSGPVMAHRVKERGNWTRSVALNLDDNPAEWDNVLRGGRTPVVVADDFVGTGDTIAALVPRLTEMLELYPQTEVRILLVAGFLDGIQRVRQLELKYGDRVKVVVGRLLQDSDSCFATGTSLLSPFEREAFAEYCDRFGEMVGTGIPRGYGGIGALFVFPESVPNTTLPLLWYDGKPDRWRPLIPASLALPLIPGF